MISLLSEFELAFGNLPGEPESNQVIYVENGLNPELKRFIEKNHDNITKLFSDYGLEFIYLTDWINNVSDDDLMLTAKYYLPWFKPEDMDYLRDACTVNLNELQRKLTPSDAPAAVIGAKGHAYKINVNNPRLYAEQLRQIAEAYGNNEARFPMVGEEIPEYSPILEEEEKRCSLFLEEDELDRLYRQVKRMLPEWAVRQMLTDKLKTQEVLSKIRIGYQSKLILPEYSIKIELRPVEMAFYILFLKHPEGIEFKQLIDYRDELLGYYKHYATFEDITTIENAIDRVVDPLNYNARDTQRSRIQLAINNAFRNRFCEDYAKYYVIDGKRGEPKKITLPQELVKFDIDL